MRYDDCSSAALSSVVKLTEFISVLKPLENIVLELLCTIHTWGNAGLLVLPN